jgi:thymidylate synthase (FAD)
MKVELVEHFGSDNMVVDTARVSFNKRAEQYTEEQNAKLIKFLADNKHTAPFRHPHLQFRVQVPIYVERQLFKHQVGWSANSISGRYVDFSDSYDRIGVWRKQSKNSKQGSEGEIENQKEASRIEAEIIDRCRSAYAKLLQLGVSKEQARTILPLNLNTEYIWTGSFQAFMHLCHLRLKPDAQEETRKVVGLMLMALKNLEGEPFKYSIEAFGF